MSKRGAVAEKMTVAVFTAPREIVLEQRTRPELGPLDVLVEVSHCGVCGSDVHLVMWGWGQTGTIPGHEWSGTVVAVGSEVTRWQQGDLVVGGPTARCGKCKFCIAGRPSLCIDRAPMGIAYDGAFAELTRVPESELLPIPKGLGMREAALAEPLAVALHGITRAGVIETDARVLITGFGPIGQVVLAALLARGINNVSVSEPTPVRADLAASMGATLIDPSTVTMHDDPMRIIKEPYDLVLECSGNVAAQQGALGQLGRGGTLVYIGAGIKRPTLDANRILLNELLVTGAFVYDADGFERALELLSSGVIPTDLLIEPGDVPLGGLLGALEALEGGTIAAKVMIAPGLGTGA